MTTERTAHDLIAEAHDLIAEAAARLIEDASPATLEDAERRAEEFTKAGLSIDEALAAGLSIIVGAILLDREKNTDA